jgi:hypothetical protein
MKTLTEHLTQLAERMSDREAVYLVIKPRGKQQKMVHFNSEDQMLRKASQYLARKEDFDLVHGVHYDYESRQDWIFHASREYGSKIDRTREPENYKQAIKKAIKSEKTETYTTMLEAKKAKEMIDLLNEARREKMSALDRKTKTSIARELKKRGLDGNKRFNSLGIAKAELDKVFDNHGLEIVGWGKVRQGDNDIRGNKGKGNADLISSDTKTEYANWLVVSWEHLESGFEVMTYVS